MLKSTKNKYGIMRDVPKMFPTIKSKRAALIWERCQRYNASISSAWDLRSISTSASLHLSLYLSAVCFSLFLLNLMLHTHWLHQSVSEPKVRLMNAVTSILLRQLKCISGQASIYPSHIKFSANCHKNVGISASEISLYFQTGFTLL